MEGDSGGGRSRVFTAVQHQIKNEEQFPEAQLAENCSCLLKWLSWEGEGVGGGAGGREWVGGERLAGEGERGSLLLRGTTRERKAVNCKCGVNQR